MKITSTPIEGLLVLEPRIFRDERGYFFESYNKSKYENPLLDVDYVQDNESYSDKGTLRGLHYQKEPYGQSKLVRVVRGSVYDVAVDLRKDSLTYGQHFGLILSGENKKQFFIPKGFAHGYLVLDDATIFQYKCDQYYHPDSESGLRWDDPTLQIEWPIENRDLIISEKDQNLPFFQSIKERP